MALQFDPKKIIEHARRIGCVLRLRVVGPKPMNLVTDPEAIADQARKVRGLARLFAAACDFSLAADSFAAAAELYRAAGCPTEAEDCDENFDANAFEAMDRILRISAASEGENQTTDGTVEVVLEVAS